MDNSTHDPARLGADGSASARTPPQHAVARVIARRAPASQTPVPTAPVIEPPQPVAPDPNLELFCPQCGYSLRGIVSPRCPECGTAIDYDKLSHSQIPWVRRREIGECRAYWQTLWLVMSRPRLLWTEIARPVNLADAQRFRWSTLSRVYIPLLLATIVMYMFEPLQRFSSVFVNWAYQAFWPVVVLHVCFILFLAAASGIPAMFFTGRRTSLEHQQRAAALSHYTVAPLGLMPIAYLVSFFTYWSDLLFGQPLMGNWTVAQMSVTVLPGALLLWWYVGVLRLAGRALQRESEYVFTTALAVPVLWVLLAFLLLVVLPVVIAYATIMIVSWE